MKKENAPTADPNSEAYKNMLDLLAVFSEADSQMRELQAECDQEMLDLLDARRVDYAALQATLTRTETALETIALAHPEWFTVRQSVKTPYGTVKFRKSTKLEVPNEEVSIVLIEQHAERNTQDFVLANYVRQKKELDMEALEKLDDALLKLFRIKRVPSQTFSVAPAKLDMGKAVKEAAEA